MAQTITLNNGTVHPVTWCGASGGVLYIECTDINTLQDALDEFSDAEATAEIIYEFGSDLSETHTGYTRLFRLAQDLETGYITVTLKKEA